MFQILSNRTYRPEHCDGGQRQQDGGEVHQRAFGKYDDRPGDRSDGHGGDAIDERRHARQLAVFLEIRRWNHGE